MAEQNQKCDLSPLTRFERQLKCFQCNQCKDVDLDNAIKQRMEDSTLRSFLYHHNSTQLQQSFIQEDKLERIQFDIGKNLFDVKDLERINDFCENVFELIGICLRDSHTGKITVKNILRRMKLLRMTGSKVSNMDNTLCRLDNLEALVLAGNCLSSFHGGSLPRGLMLLELCNNKLDDLCSLSDNPPPILVYLGLARNNLTSGVAEFLNKFKFLYHLDLSQNNIEDLSEVVMACSEMQSLSSLLLIGNPCSMSPNYLTFVLKNLPKLIFLDGDVLKKQGNEEECGKFSDPCMLGVLQIHLFRIMGIPQPSNEKINNKKVTHTYRMEIESPILHQFMIKRENSFFIDESLFKNEEDSKKLANENLKRKKNDDGTANERKKKSSEGVKDKENKTSSGGIKDKKTKKLSNDVSNKDRKKSFLGRKGKKPSKDVKQEEYLRENIPKEKNEVEIYEQELKSDQTSSQDCFKTERKNWGKILEFKEPAIKVSCWDLRPLRDLFRTVLNLRIVHLKTLPPVSNLKIEPKKQKKSSQPEELHTGDDDTNKEVLVSKSTLAKIAIPLQDITWSKQYLEYAWDKSKPYNVQLTSGLKNLQYVAKMKKGPKGIKDEVKSGEILIPTILTCHVGVGVKRENNQRCDSTRLA